MLSAKELLRIGALSAAITGGAGVVALVGAVVHSNEVVACQKVDKSLRPECLAAANDAGDAETGAYLVAGVGLLGLAASGFGLYEQYTGDDAKESAKKSGKNQ